MWPHFWLAKATPPLLKKKRCLILSTIIIFTDCADGPMLFPFFILHMLPHYSTSCKFLNEPFLVPLSQASDIKIIALFLLTQKLFPALAEIQSQKHLYIYFVGLYCSINLVLMNPERKEISCSA